MFAPSSPSYSLIYVSESLSSFSLFRKQRPQIDRSENFNLVFVYHREAIMSDNYKCESRSEPGNQIEQKFYFYWT